MGRRRKCAGRSRRRPCHDLSSPLRCQGNGNGNVNGRRTSWKGGHAKRMIQWELNAWETSYA